MDHPNYAALVQVASTMGPLNEHLVYVGGVVVGLLITDSGAAEIRVTRDVDCIVEVATRAEYDTRVRDQLIERGFVEMQGDNIPICAWIKDGIRVDVMPVSGILGFSNSWYDGAIRSARTIQIEGIVIRVINPHIFS